MDVIENGEIVGTQLDNLGVLDDSRGSSGLGQNNSSRGDVVADKNGARSGVVLLSQSQDVLVGEKRTTSGAKRRVGFDDDSLFLAEFSDVQLRKQRVVLDLVGSRDDFGLLQQVSQIRNGEVGDTNALDLGAFLVELFELSPGLDDAERGIVISGSIRSGRDQRMVTIRIESNWPVNEQKINIVETKLLERQVQRLLDSAVISRENLGSDKDFFTSDLSRGNGLLDTSSNLFLVAISKGSINVLITSFGQSIFDGLFDSSLRRLPGTETQGRN